jgi:hypothetical protein
MRLNLKNSFGNSSLSIFRLNQNSIIDLPETHQKGIQLSLKEKFAVQKQADDSFTKPNYFFSPFHWFEIKERANQNAKTFSKAQAQIDYQALIGDKLSSLRKIGNTNIYFDTKKNAGGIKSQAFNTFNHKMRNNELQLQSPEEMSSYYRFGAAAYKAAYNQLMMEMRDEQLKSNSSVSFALQSIVLSFTFMSYGNEVDIEEIPFKTEAYTKERALHYIAAIRTLFLEDFEEQDLSTELLEQRIKNLRDTVSNDSVNEYLGICKSILKYDKLNELEINMRWCVNFSFYQLNRLKFFLAVRTIVQQIEQFITSKQQSSDASNTQSQIADEMRSNQR